MMVKYLRLNIQIIGRVIYISRTNQFLSALLFTCLLFTSSIVETSFSAPISASSIERSQEILQDDKVLRQRIEQEKKFFIKEIIVKGDLSLSEGETKDIIAPFKGQWITKEDILGIIDSLKSASANFFPG